MPDDAGQALSTLLGTDLTSNEGWLVLFEA